MSNYWNQVYNALWEDLWKDIEKGYYDDDIDYDEERWQPHKNTKEWDLKLELNTTSLVHINLVGIPTLKQQYYQIEDEIYDLKYQIEFLTEQLESIKEDLEEKFNVQISS